MNISALSLLSIWEWRSGSHTIRQIVKEETVCSPAVQHWSYFKDLLTTQIPDLESKDITAHLPDSGRYKVQSTIEVNTARKTEEVDFIAISEVMIRFLEFYIQPFFSLIHFMCPSCFTNADQLLIDQESTFSNIC